MYSYYWPSLGEVSVFMVAFGIAFFLICLGLNAYADRRK